MYSCISVGYVSRVEISGSQVYIEIYTYVYSALVDIAITVVDILKDSLGVSRD